MKKDIKLYIGYVGNQTVENFNLKENDTVKLINLDNHVSGNDINNLNCYYSELCVAYYVWKNQLKSDYISIGQHRRYITSVDFDKLDKGMVQMYPVFHGNTNESAYMYMIKDGINESIIIQFTNYLLKHTNKSREEIFNAIYKDNFEIYFFNVFCCNWKTFNKICKFIFGFMKEIIPSKKYDEFDDLQLWVEHMQLSFSKIENIYNKNELFNDCGRIKSGDRCVGAIFEILLPIYCKLMFGTFDSGIQRKVGIELDDVNDNTKDILFKFMSKNTFGGVLQYVIKVSKENYNKLKKIIDCNFYDLSSAYINIQTDDLPEYVIKLNLNEYIDVNTPFDKNYTIKTNNYNI